VLEGVAGTKYLEVRPVDEVTVRQALSAAREQGVSSVSVVLAHSYACPEHELRVGAIARELGFSHVTLSHQAMPAIHGHQLIESHDHFLMVIFLQIEHNAREKEKNEQNDARHQKLGIHLAMDGRVNFKYVVYGKTGDGTQKYHDAQDAEAVLYELPKAHILFEGKR